ncbi:peptidylprolyl isomerase [Paenibacillus sp. TRM 82003]|nr:peptidylprolyl isomerase [Paenibacillus sp. TRM 82003]
MKETFAKLKLLSVGALVGAAMTASVGASAAGQHIEVYFNQLKVFFDGTEKPLPAGQGAFVYQGTTYVPLRYMSESLGLPVHYDAARQHIRVGERYAEAPALSIDASKTYRATLTTSKGDIVIELFAKDAPLTVNNFVFLAQEGFYENVPFHRVLEDFVIQGGDPTGTGRGGPGYAFADELDNGHTYEPGIVAMANAGPNTNGSQFFICTGEESNHLNSVPNYTIFGKVVEGMDVVRAIASAPVKANDSGEASRPVEAIHIKKVAVDVE